MIATREWNVEAGSGREMDLRNLGRENDRITFVVGQQRSKLATAGGKT